MGSTQQAISFSIAAGKIDAEAGVIRGVSLITEGPALGHGVSVDATTLAQVKGAAEQYEGGLKVKVDHGSGAGDIVGYITNFRIEGQKLLGDLNLLKTSPHRDYLLEIAEKIPDTFGLSIAFSGPAEMSADKTTILQRCSEIFSVDIVSEPAANPGGLFSRKSTKPTQFKMDEEHKKEIAGMIEAAMLSIGERISKLETGPQKQPDEKAAMEANTQAVELAAKTAAMEALKEFAKQFGTPAAPAVSAEQKSPAAATVEQKFETLVAAKAAELKGDKSAAIAFCINKHAAEYAAYRARVASGEVIKL